MAMIFIISVLISAVVGIIAKFILDKMNTSKEITWIEYVIVMAVITLIAAPGSIYIQWNMAKENLTEFHEFYNGWETDVRIEATTCERDGWCAYDYSCDPYTYTYSCDCDDKGNCNICSETRWHDCPYVDTEYSYYVSTTIGEFTIDRHRFPDNPQNRRWRESEPIPNAVIAQAQTGEPPFWTKVKERVRSGIPGPVTKKMNYKNYIYASENNILKQFSPDIERYEKKGLFPKFQKDIFSFYYSDKVYFVGFRPDDARDWFTNSYYLNAAIGRNLEGDLHLVLIKNDDVAREPDTYMLSLKAYWQDKKKHGQDTLSKNAIVVICFTDGNKILTARSFTGMPQGNQEISVAVSNRLKGVDLKPELVLGNLRGDLKDKWIENIHSSGIIEDIVFGLTEKNTKFKRISMEAKHAKDNGLGYLFLATDIQPTEKQKNIIYVVTFFICLIGWIVAIVVGDKTYKRW